MNFTYTKGWFRAHKRPLAIWTEKQALQEHEAQRPYTVLVGEDPQRPTAFLEVNLGLGFAGVNFLDQELRPYLEYKFTQEGDRFFLQETLQRKYGPGNDEVVYTETYTFTPAGQVTIRLNDLVAKEITTKTATDPIDVSKNWENIPEFGQYEGFARKER